MAPVLIIVGSPSATSRTARLAGLVRDRLGELGVPAALLDVRGLPPAELMRGAADAPEIASAVAQVAGARGVVIATPIYKASYSGLLKTFLDLLPQFGLRDKVVLPLATGGTLAHVLAIDYGLRPVLSSLDALHVVSGLFVLDKQIGVQVDGAVELDPDLSAKLDLAIAGFVSGLQRATPLSSA